MVLQHAFKILFWKGCIQQFRVFFWIIFPITNHCPLFIQVLFVNVGAIHKIFNDNFYKFCFETSLFYWNLINWRGWRSHMKKRWYNLQNWFWHIIILFSLINRPFLWVTTLANLKIRNKFNHLAWIFLKPYFNFLLIEIVNYW